MNTVVPLRMFFVLLMVCFATQGALAEDLEVKIRNCVNAQSQSDDCIRLLHSAFTAGNEYNPTEIQGLWSKQAAIYHLAGAPAATVDPNFDPTLNIYKTTQGAITVCGSPAPCKDDFVGPDGPGGQPDLSPLRYLINVVDGVATIAAPGPPNHTELRIYKGNLIAIIPAYKNGLCQWHTESFMYRAPHNVTPVAIDGVCEIGLWIRQGHAP